MRNYTVCSGRVAIGAKGCGWYERRLLGRLKPCLVGLQYLRGASYSIRVKPTILIHQNETSIIYSGCRPDIGGLRRQRCR